MAFVNDCDNATGWADVNATLRAYIELDGGH